MKRARTLRVLLVALAALSSGCFEWHSGAMEGEPADATFAAIEGARVRFVDEGEGPPVVLIHGFASSLDAWEPVIPTLRAEHRVIALDLKGFGWTDRPAGDYSPEAQARIVLALLDARGVDRVSVVAHSYGSSVALALALAAPERVERIALYDAYVYAGQRNTFFQWADADGMGEALFGAFYDQRMDERIPLAFYDEASVDQARVDRVNLSLQRPGTRSAALAAVRQMGLAARQERYSEIEAPTLLLWGREDRITTLPWGERLASEMPNAELRVYPRCGHFPMVEAANRSTRDLARFLSAPPREVEPPSREPALRAPEPDAPPSPAPPALQPPSDDAETSGGEVLAPAEPPLDGAPEPAE